MKIHKATVTEFRAHTKRFFDLVERGETIRVFRNGKPIADIHKIRNQVRSWKQRKVQPLTIKGISMSRNILEERGQQ